MELYFARNYARQSTGTRSETLSKSRHDPIDPHPHDPREDHRGRQAAPERVPFAGRSGCRLGSRPLGIRIHPPRPHGLPVWNRRRSPGTRPGGESGRRGAPIDELIMGRPRRGRLTGPRMVGTDHLSTWIAPVYGLHDRACRHSAGYFTPVIGRNRLPRTRTWATLERIRTSNTKRNQKLPKGARKSGPYRTKRNR